MTPIERIRQKREMVQLSAQAARPRSVTQAFPRNSAGLAVILLLVAGLVYKATVVPTPANILGYSACVTGFGLAVLCLSLGQKHVDLYKANPVAKGARVPFKCIGSVLMGSTAAGLTLFQGGVFAQAAGVLPVVSALALIAFGMDPMRSKGLSTELERHAHKLETYAARLGNQMERVHKSAARLAVPEVVTEIRRFEEAALRLLSAMTDDPARANTVRRNFSVYLEGVAQAAEGFTTVYVDSGSSVAQSDYIALMQRMSAAYGQKAQSYAAAGQDKLDVQMQVLDDYLTREAPAH